MRGKKMKTILNKYILLLCLLNLSFTVSANNYKSVVGEWKLRASYALFEFYGDSILPQMITGVVGNVMLPISIIEDGTLIEHFYDKHECFKWRYIDNDSTLIEIDKGNKKAEQYHAYFFLRNRKLHLYLININNVTISMELVGEDTCKCYIPDSLYASEIVFTHYQKTIEEYNLTHKESKPKKEVFESQESLTLDKRRKLLKSLNKQILWKP